MGKTEYIIYNMRIMEQWRSGDVWINVSCQVYNITGNQNLNKSRY